MTTKQPKPIKGTDAVFFLERLDMVACGLMNYPTVKGQLTPATGQFHTPCPFEKRKPDDACLSCQFVRIAPLIRRRTTEAEANVREKATPGEWKPFGLTPYAQDGN